MSNMTNEQSFAHQQKLLEKEIEGLSREKLPTANIIVAGKTGAGKSTLLNAVFGNEFAAVGTGRPVTDQIKEYQNSDIPIRIWDTVGLELDSKKTKGSINAIKHTVAVKSESGDKFDRIHAIWYCVNSGTNRYEGAELEFIQDLHAIGVPFIIVLTQCYAAKSKINEFVDIINKTNREKGMSDISVVKVLAQDFSVEIGDSVLKVPSYGLNDLVNKTLKELPAFIKSGFAAAQKISKSEKRTACEEIIYEYICAAKYGFWDKVPLINVFTTDKKIFNMFKKIGQLYNTVLKEEDIKKITQGAHIDFKNAFWGLVAPVDLVGYNRKIADLLQSKKEDGFNVYYEHFTNNERAARMIAFYGYTFIDSIEELWEKSTEEELKKVDIVVEKLIEIINRNLSKRENEYRQSRR